MRTSVTWPGGMKRSRAARIRSLVRAGPGSAVGSGRGGVFGVSCPWLVWLEMRVGETPGPVAAGAWLPGSRRLSGPCLDQLAAGLLAFPAHLGCGARRRGGRLGGALRGRVRPIGEAL